VQPPSDHQVKDDPEIVSHSKGNTLADSPQRFHISTFGTRERRLSRPQQKWTRDAYLLQRLTYDSRS